MTQILTEITPAEQAKSLGLKYLGFGGWGNPSDRVVVARTINGRLVKVDREEESKRTNDMGRLTVIDLDDELLYNDLKSASGDSLKLIRLIKSLFRNGSDVIVMHSRNSEKKVAKFLHDLGIRSGPTLVPYGSSDPDKKRALIEKKIKAGYHDIRFFDRDPKTIHAVESLKAPYNKVLTRLDTFQIPKLKYSPEERKDSDDTA